MEHPNDKMPGSEMMIYTTEDGLTKIETTFDGDTVWLSADQMAELFQRDKSTISRLSLIHIYFPSADLDRPVCSASCSSVRCLSTTRRSLSRSGIDSFAYIQSPLSSLIFQ